MTRAWAVLVVAAALLLPSVSRAQIQKRGPEVWPGKNDIHVSIGFQAGMNNYGPIGRPMGGTPGGFKLLFDYSFRFQDKGPYTLWLDFGFNVVIGGGCAFNGNFYTCSGFTSGDTIEPLAGVQMKFKTPIPLVPYARFDASFVGIFNRYCGDNGFAVAGRIGGGAKYFLTKRIGLGIDTGFVLGPAYYEGAPAQSCVLYTYSSHVEFYAAFDFSVGAEFVF